ncbi:hypothetical protein CHS0354_011771 [Potamilus streckersoni]|uniref:Uncharacterized protein n=1 Tax=Potamilus streckersoni TaxID=2493646 RepID=A0AAE0TGG6_9BIVA|nr:hypothetical protein CHS0354_011771 [Potamilus streckersoni]
MSTREVRSYTRPFNCHDAHCTTWQYVLKNRFFSHHFNGSDKLDVSRVLIRVSRLFEFGTERSVEKHHRSCFIRIVQICGNVWSFINLLSRTNETGFGETIVNFKKRRFHTRSHADRGEMAVIRNGERFRPLRAPIARLVLLRAFDTPLKAIAMISKAEHINIADANDGKSQNRQRVSVLWFLFTTTVL